MSGRDTSGLFAELPRLLPLASAWAEDQSRAIRFAGRSLSPKESDLAVTVGVRRPDLVRLLPVDRIPAPAEPALEAACDQLGFLGDTTLGLTLGYGVYLKAEAAASRRLLAHELRHVAQYESYPSIGAYLAVYLPQLLELGYENAPLERDARRAEGAGSGCV
jgi:hypothetical protein